MKRKPPADSGKNKEANTRKLKKTVVEEKKQQKASQKNKQMSKLMQIIEDSDEMAEELFEVNQDEQDSTKQGKVQFKDEVVVLYDPDKKWSTPIQNQKKGKFSPEEKAALEKSVDRYCSLKHITKEDLQKIVTEGEPSQKNKKMWVTICGALPNRSIASCFRFLQRQLNLNNKQGKWSAEETQLLKRLYDEFGNTKYHWKTIAERLNRTAQNVRDKYYSMMSESAELPFWSMSETVQLVREVEEQIDTKISSHSGLDSLDSDAAMHDQMESQERSRRSYNSSNFTFHNLKTLSEHLKYEVIRKTDFEGVRWRAVAEQLKTKSKDQCRFRWRQIIAYQHSTFKPSSLKEDAQFIKQIEQQEPRQESDIDFNISNGRTQQENKQRWLVLKRFVNGRTSKSFSDVLKDIRTHIRHPKLQSQ